MAKLIGNQPNQVPTNGDLGTMAYQDSDNVVVGNLSADGAVVINESGADVDFRIESDTRTNAFFLDGATGNVGIGTSSPQSRTEIIGSVSDFSSGTFSRSNAILTLYNSNITGANQGSILAFDSEYDDGGSGGRATFALIKGANDTWGNTGSGNLQFFTSAPGAASSLQERMRINSSGNVGIGTTSNINGALTVFNGTDFSTDSISNGDNIYLISDATSGDGVYGSSIAFSRVQYPDRRAAAIASVQTGADEDNVGLAFFTHPSGTASVPIVEAMRIDSSGNLLVGTTTALSSASTGEGTSILNKNAIVVAVNGSDANLILNRTDSSTGDLCIFRYNGATKGSISTNGTTTAYNTTSDYRLKEDWQPMSGSIDRLKALNPVNFAWKADGSRVDGFLAHEAAEVVPEAVTGTKDAVEAIGTITDAEGTVVQENVTEPAELAEGQTWTKTEDRPVYQGIDQSKLTPLLTAALQDTLALVEAQAAKIEALETRIAALEV